MSPEHEGKPPGRRSEPVRFATAAFLIAAVAGSAVITRLDGGRLPKAG